MTNFIFIVVVVILHVYATGSASVIFVNENHFLNSAHHSILQYPV